MSAATEACQATVASSWRLVKPIALRSARSCRRRRTDAARVSASATTALDGEAGGECRGRVPGVLVADDFCGLLDGEHVEGAAAEVLVVRR